jgi:hypothetical protein
MTVDDARTIEQQLQERLLSLLLDTSKPAKPIDPNAPFPHWFKRSIQRAWIKHQREMQNDR